MGLPAKAVPAECIGQRHSRQPMQIRPVRSENISPAGRGGGLETLLPSQLELPGPDLVATAKGMAEVGDGRADAGLDPLRAIPHFGTGLFRGQRGQDRVAHGMRADGHQGIPCQLAEIIPAQGFRRTHLPPVETRLPEHRVDAIAEPVAGQRHDRLPQRDKGIQLANTN